MPSAACPRCGRAVAPSTGRCPHCDAAPAGGRSRVQLATPRPADLTAPTAPPAAPTTAQRAAEGLVEGTRTGVRTGTRLFRRLPRRAKIIVLAVIAALVVGVPATLWVVGRVAYSPEEPVEDLVAAFNDGDAVRAATLAGCSSRLCGAAALGENYEPPRGVSIVNVAMGGDTSPDTADIRIRYTLAGERQESVLRVRRDGGLLPQEWRLESGATGTLEVSAPGLSSVKVGGVEIAVAADSGRTGRNQALIGAYRVTATPGNGLYQDSAGTAPITGDLRTRGVTTVTLTPAVRTDLADDAKRQVREFLEACARSPEYEPVIDGRECPFAHKWPVPDRSTPAVWTIDPFPEFELMQPDQPTREPRLEVRTTKPGRATVTYTSRGKAETYRYEVTVHGTVTVDASGKVIWTI